ncbi:adenylate/guanylate cyclase domain-containing protein [Aurantimonas sp. A2-1-M11]|uniref:adenylate/guanylate cyclase domain-containing protein n=1 Tax=Aurantimonas sp. A2-1-M11 TaxID=3113712 RepID=UPI002F91E794
MKSRDQSEGPRRRLGAALFADIVNYADLMSRDEIGTHAAVIARLRLLGQIGEKHRGEVVQRLGDGIFMLFDSAVDCVCFAMQAQNAMQSENAGVPSERHIVFRIGIHCGEILFDDEGIGGDTINIAARIESLAPPGSIVLTSTVHEQVRNKVTAGFEYLGPRVLKNIAEPAELFLLREDSEPTAMTPALRVGRPDRVAAMRGQSVVILPFKFDGKPGSENWLAHGLTEDITTNLSRFHNLFVIARNSAFVYREKKISPLDAGHLFGVRYVIHGTVRRSGKRIRITIQLVDVIRDRTIWGEHYNRNLDDIFEIQDEITRIVVAAIAVQIEASERERLRSVPPSDLRAYGFVLQGQQHSFQYRREENLIARRLYDAALQADPLYARALAAKSRTLNLDWRYNWGEDTTGALDEALNLALSATLSDETDARGFGELGYAHLYRKEHDASISAYRRALLLNPNDADLMSDMADALAHSGQSEEAIALLEKAMQLNPFFPDQYLWHLGGAYYKLYRYDEAMQAIQSMQNPTEGRRVLAACYAQLGRLDDARFEAEKVLKAHPGFRVEHWANVLPDRLQSDVEHFVEGLQKAGLR